MTAIPLVAAPPLLDLLGARWRVGVTPRALAWDGVAGFALADGTLALAPPSWDGAPMVRPRNGGGAEVVPGSVQAPPVARLAVHRGACLSVVHDPDGGFLTGGGDGRVVRVLPDAEMRPIGHLGRAASVVAAGAGGWRICAAGSSVHRFGAAGSRLDVAGAVTSLAVEPGGARLAIGHEGGVTLWAGGDTPRVLAAPATHCGVAWSRDGRWLGSFTPDGVLHAGQPPETVAVGEPVRALVGSADGFVAAAGRSVLLWRPATRPQLCGVSNQEPVTRVACHPDRTLIAAGYANGAVVLCEPNSTSMLLVRAAGEGAVTALGFSPDGDHLAIGTEAGEIAVLATPAALFRADARAA